MDIYKADTTSETLVESISVGLSQNVPGAAGRAAWGGCTQPIPDTALSAVCPAWHLLGATKRS